MTDPAPSDLWVHAVIDVPAELLGVTAMFWSSALGWRMGDPWPHHAELRSFVPPRGTPYVHLQRIDGSPRVHIDLGTSTRSAADELMERALSAGARMVAAHDRWHTLLSPGHLPFCVVVDANEPPPAVTWPGGRRTRLVQVCLDSPRSRHDREVSFWRTVLVGRWHDSDADEFAGKWHRDGSPLQLLFQRLDEPDGPVRAHLDLGTDDVAAETERLLHVGAQEAHAGRGWHVMTDPAGLHFCATGNSPVGVRGRDLG